MRIERQVTLTEDDRQMLLDLWIRAWTPVVPSIDFAGQRGWLSDHLDALVADGAVLLLLRNEAGRLLAFLSLQAGTGKIDQLAVGPDAESRGLGRALMDEAKRLSPAGLRLRVNTINTRAVRFYGKAGFVVTGETVSERSGLPVLMMAWRAPP